MSSRFTLRAPLESVAERFHFDAPRPAVPWGPRYNLKPGDRIPVVLPGGRLETMTWGLVTSSEHNQGFATKYTATNARAERLHETPSFQGPLRFERGGRCLVLADGFYKWPQRSRARNGSDPSSPRYVYLTEGRPFACAGLWAASADNHKTCAIVTTRANRLIASIPHDRMPVILEKGGKAVWLDPGQIDPRRLQWLFVPYPIDEMAFHEVAPLADNRDNDSCIRPLDPSRPSVQLPGSEEYSDLPLLAGPRYHSIHQIVTALYRMEEGLSAEVMSARQTLADIVRDGVVAESFLSFPRDVGFDCPTEMERVALHYLGTQLPLTGRDTQLVHLVAGLRIIFRHAHRHRHEMDTTAAARFLGGIRDLGVGLSQMLQRD